MAKRIEVIGRVDSTATNSIAHQREVDDAKQRRHLVREHGSLAKAMQAKLAQGARERAPKPVDRRVCKGCHRDTTHAPHRDTCTVYGMAAYFARVTAAVRATEGV